MFFNRSKPFTYHGEHSSSALSEFVMDILRPSVINLDYRQFKALVEGKPKDEMWLVDFYAPCESGSNVETARTHSIAFIVLYFLKLQGAVRACSSPPNGPSWPNSSRRSPR